MINQLQNVDSFFSGMIDCCPSKVETISTFSKSIAGYCVVVQTKKFFQATKMCTLANGSRLLLQFFKKLKRDPYGLLKDIF